MTTSVSVRGDGVAACCCAMLLKRRGIPLTVDRTARSHLPFVLMSRSTLNLLSEVFEDSDLFVDGLVIHKRIVVWTNQTSPVVLPHFGMVISEARLLQRLWALVDGSQPPRSEANWKVLTANDTALPESELFGSRIAYIGHVHMTEACEQDACYVEAWSQGWIFLLPTGERRATILSVGAPLEAALEQSRLIRAQVAAVLNAEGQFPAYPRILRSLCGPGWFACGTAAAGFDPICGEGAGNAVREAILASAALDALSRHADQTESILDHYRSRLLAGFLKHLELCRTYYASGPAESWWNQELSRLEQGIHWTRSTLAALPPSPYRLNGFDLERLAAPVLR